jgi:hypothetical protein
MQRVADPKNELQLWQYAAALLPPFQEKEAHALHLTKRQL